MIPIRGVYEVVIRVHDLARAEEFYCEQLGLEVGLRGLRAEPAAIG
jgi:catechol 2,3-dioxygenase-like lactoylglutathione lyase family enzyme